MDCSRRDWNRNQRYGNCASVSEPEYDTVDDQEEVLSVRILPARPIHEEREYADRDLPRSSSAQSLSSLSSGKSNSFPKENHPNHTSGPAVNRDLKPGRRKTRLAKRLLPVQPGEQQPYRCSASPPPFTSELVHRLSALNLQETSRKDEDRAAKRTDLGPHHQGGNHSYMQQDEGVTGSQNADHGSILHSNPRHSLDLESQDVGRRSQQNLERAGSKRHHHEWPQTKEDFQHLDFVPMEKPQQSSCEEDWYVGPCNRTDAEHALHLVNKDGAFLVRDCSLNTNSEPLVLAVYHDKKVYNVKIRFIERDSKFVLGTAQRSNDMFDSVADIIKFHSIFPITLISGRNIPGNRYPENCVLTCPITKWDVERLLQ